MIKRSLKWPENLVNVTHACSVCHMPVQCEENYLPEIMMDDNGTQYNKFYTPSSRYWNPEHKHVYCSAQHSLDAHEANYKL